MPNSDTRLSPTNILNRSYDPTYDLIAVIPMEENAAGTAVVRQKAIGKAEDSPHVTGDIGVPMWGVRVDAYPPSGVFGADGDYIPIATNYKGDVKVVAQNVSGASVNVATEESAKGIAPLSGASANGTRDLTSANTWYAVPSTVPASPYALVATVESVAGTVRWGFDNTGTPSATNGQRLTAAGDEVIVRLAANQVIYFASSSAGDDINWSTKII